MADRNGFGTAYPLTGHRGENFILQNKPVLQKHPEWLVSPLTGHDYKDQGIKLNYLHKDAVNFYTYWTIQSMIQSKADLPPPNHTEFVSIEPADGGGYLNERETNSSLPSISDQVYGAANLAALPIKEAGKIWKTNVSGKFNYNFLNIPDRYLLLEGK